MKTSLAIFASTSLLFSVAAATGTLQLGIKRSPTDSQQIRRRATSETVAVPLVENTKFVQYYANVTVGTPPQSVTLIIDTGSSDVWVVAATAPICETDNACAHGTFDFSQSSTFDDVDPGDFQDSYADGTGTTGDFFTDNFSIGDITVDSFIMGLALNTSIATGIMGLGFDTEEDGGLVQYPNLVDSMVNQSIISTQAYSLWLDDRDAGTGSLLFGGIDTGKFTGDLFNIAMYPSEDTGIVDRFTVAFTTLSITSPSGSEILTPAGYAEAVVLDSGTTMTIVPDDLAQAIYNVVGANFDDNAGAAICPCSIGNVDGTVDFQFAGAYGPVIKVPLSELVYPYFLEDGTQGTFQDGQPACSFGIEPLSVLGSSDATILFGDTVLRSAYVVYDLANFRIGLAATNFNSTTTNVVAFESLNAQIPSATTVTNEAAVTQTAGKGNVGVGGAGATATEAAGTVAATSAMFTGPAGAAFATAYTQTVATKSSASATGTGKTATGTGKKSAGVPGPKPFAWEQIALFGLCINLMLLGGGMLLAL